MVIEYIRVMGPDLRQTAVPAEHCSKGRNAIQPSSGRIRVTGNARQLERVVLVNQFTHAIIAVDVPLCTRAWVLYR